MPTLMRIESAPLGAFVPWKPLAQIVVPAMEPGESRELSTEVVRPRPVPLGDFDSVPPRRLLTAISPADQPSGNDGSGGLLNLLLLRQRQKANRSDRADVGSTSLAPDLWDRVGRGQPRWAGNINVFVGQTPVERHMAKALRVYPGRTNLAMFIVGTPGKRDSFAFELVGLNPDWKAALCNVTNGKSLLDTSESPIRECQWVESNGMLMVMLATQPPENCSAGTLEVHVRRRTDEKEAIVEFSLDPKAQGTGCYFV
jgi:hypothetical protein